MKNNNLKSGYYQHTDGTVYDYGKLYDLEGKKYDITVILNYNPTIYDDNTDDEQDVRIIDFYYGDPTDEYTANCVKQYIEKQKQFKLLLDKLCSLKTILPDNTIDEQIEFVKSQLHKLY